MRAVAVRLLVAAGLLVLLSVVVFVGVDLLPGDPVTARLGAQGPEVVAEARTALGLDRPLAERYVGWLAGLARGDLGTSASGRPVTDMLSERLGNSVLLAGLAAAVLVPVSLLLGVFAGLRRGRVGDRVISTGLLLVVSIPEFVLAGGLVLVLPTLSLVLVSAGYAGRVIRAATAAASRAPHVEFLRLNGIAPATVLRTAMLPAVLPAAVQVWLVSVVGLVGGAVLVERVFGYPGVGELLITAVRTGDLPVVQALAMLLGGAILLALLVADLGVRALTPALRTAIR